MAEVPRRRFRMHYGLHDGYGYVVCDSQTDPGEGTPNRWRGSVLFRTHSRSEAEAKAAALNGEESPFCKWKERTTTWPYVRACRVAAVTEVEYEGETLPVCTVHEQVAQALASS